ncbi:MAG: hypothetical protein K2P44_12995 [Lachnospiraceae bacterium]|nr:hypothetical protein [Lachnospiraceae bacterium]
MGEDYSKIKQMFAKNDTSVIIDSTKKQETLAQIKTRMRELTTTVPTSRWQTIKIQIFYMDKVLLMLHLAACIGIVLLGNRHNWEQYSMIFASVLGVLSLLEVSILFSSGMTELAESCYYNVRQIVAFQMTCSGIISMTALLIAFVYAGFINKSLAIETGLYMLVPFVSTECIYMAVMLSESGRRNKMLLVAVGVFAVLFWSTLSSIPSLYETSAIVFWGMAFLAGTGIFVMQIKRFFSALEKGEILCVD